MNKDHVIVEAKSEYTKQLLTILTEPVYEKIMAIYEKTKENTEKKNELLMNMQIELKKIPLWNQAQIDREVEKITRTCDWIGDLIAAIFISNVKILTSVKIGKDKKKIQITMPKTDNFIHKVYIKTANELYDNPYIFQQGNTKCEFIRVIRDSIEDTIRTSLPFQNILQSYLGNTLNSPEESEEEEEEVQETEPENEPENTGNLYENDDVENEETLPESYQNEDNDVNNENENEEVPSLSEPQEDNKENGFFDPPEELKKIQLGDEKKTFFDDATDTPP
uniref:Uncharacterized protein n=1 Tax=viral metagenome TaxID=1070528 RepID=A0A6C0F5K5_9ZZZZ|tara:strand:+ start:716 stop:1552 length:837 start_codon:yes stop_codon:yes gene_type:complete